LPSFRPHPSLRSRVASIQVLETAGGDSVVLPSTSVVLGMQFRGRVRDGDSLLALAGVTGIQRRAVRRRFFRRSTLTPVKHAASDKQRSAVLCELLRGSEQLQPDLSLPFAPP
jgi:hypothetical protein